MTKRIKIKDYSYELPDSKIAKYPLQKRDESKLLVYKEGKIFEHKFLEIADFIPSEYLLVRNNTKVIYARLLFRKKTGAAIEIFCLNPYLPAEYNLSFDAKNKNQWISIVGNLKKWKQDKLELSFGENRQYSLFADRIRAEGDAQLIEFTWNGDFTFGEVLEQVGKIPIPPYLNRDSEESDKNTYQTIYSRIEGSVAAPTAGLHFTEDVLKQLKVKNIRTSEVTLHVGAGTFKPVKTATIDEHQMHTEQFYVDKNELDKIYNSLGKIVAVGTTSMRTLESLYWIGVNIIQNKENYRKIEQWQPYEENIDISSEDAIEAILNFMKVNELNYIKAATQIMIVPGYKFRIVDILITNFHQPKSTLLLLVAAFIGDDWKKIYDFALKNNFRFLSYGDSSILYKNNNN